MRTILYVASHGPKQPARATRPFAAALMATEAGDQAQLLLRGDATLLLRDSVSRGVHADDWPDLSDLLGRVVARAIPLFACEACSRARGITEADLARTNATFAYPLALLELRTRADKVLDF